MMKRTLTTLTLLAVMFSMTGVVAVAQNNLSDSERRALEQELVQTEKEIQQTEVYLQNKRAETQSLERDVDILNAEIRRAQLNIRAKNLRIGDLSEEITTREQTIEELEARIGRELSSVAELIRKRKELDDRTMVEMVLSSEDLSSFFVDVDTYESVQISLQGSLNELRTLKGQNEEQKVALANEQRAEVDAKAEIETQKQQVEQKEAEKKELVAVSKSEEQTYEQLLAEKKRKAAEIRATLFPLRGSGPIPFGEALEYANQASAYTGVRAAFILGILKQESNIGANVGTCNRAGDPPSKSWKVIMKPERDHQPYLAVTSKLGLDPETTPLSCPIGNGWGGAMGPSQFIPSTWVMYEHRVANALGVSVANPWEPEHAFMATGIFLADLGAGSGGYSAEQEAAARYYAGGGWQTRGLGYASSVLSHAQSIQVNMIDPLNF